MLLDGLTVVLVRPRFPENVGMTARACANMGCPALTAVAPERISREKAAMLATPKGLPVLEGIRITETLQEALADCTTVYGTTARTGGWRRDLLSPEKAAEGIVSHLLAAEPVCLVFGPEDRGLSNQEITACHELITIPTDAASSLNLAQSVLLILYACACAMRAETHAKRPPRKTISNAELSLFLERFRAVLIRVDCLHNDNNDYFFQPWKRLFSRMGLQRSEFDALMGLCRQIDLKLDDHSHTS